jgi:hypothetical protein
VQRSKEKERPGRDAWPFCSICDSNTATSAHALVPDLREFVVAELAIGITSQIAHVRVIVVAKSL